MNSAPTYLISSDPAFAGRMKNLAGEEDLGAVTFYPAGKGALTAYREILPDVAIFDLRQDRRDVAVAMTMIREIFPRMAAGGVIVIGSADPANREALREEREQLARIQLAEYLPRSTPDEILVERIHSLQERAATQRRAVERPARESAAATPAPAAPAPAAGNEGEPVPCRLKLMLSQPGLQEILLAALADLGAEALTPNGQAPRHLDLPDFLILDGAAAEEHASYLTQLRRRLPGLRIIQLPDEGDRALRRLSRDISGMIGSSQAHGDAEQLARLIRARVGGGDSGEAPILLLVEDEQNIRELTAHYLLLQGYEVYQAEDGQEALTVFLARRPDMILSDVYMPRMNGFKLLLEVKNRAPAMPMLMMTGYSSAAQVLSQSAHVNVSFLAKPFRLSDLGERIRSMLGALR